VTVPVAAALADRPAQWADSALERLVDVRLVESPAPGRYRMHDLVRLFAREESDRHIPAPDAGAALDRAFAYYASAARQITQVLDRSQVPWIAELPVMPDGCLPVRHPEEAVAWLDAERPNLFAVLRQAATMPGERAQAAIRLAAGLTAPFRVHGDWGDRITVNRIAMELAERLGDRRAEARARMFLSDSYGRAGRLEEAIRHAERSLHLWRELGDRLGESGALNACGNTHKRRGSPAQAIICFQRSLAIRRAIGDVPAEVMLLANLGAAHLQAGRPELAIASYESAVAIAEDIDYDWGKGEALAGLGEGYRRLGRLEEAMAYHQRSLTISRRHGDRFEQARQLWGLGTIQHDLGHLDLARAHWSEALTLLNHIGAVTDPQSHALYAATRPPPPAALLLNT
jgi:tetratricopeptide (TPR) repeat protein